MVYEKWSHLWNVVASEEKTLTAYFLSQKAFNFFLASCAMIEPFYQQIFKPLREREICRVVKKTRKK